MKKALTAALVALAVALSAPAHADDTGFTGGIRASYAFPRGQYVTSQAMSNIVSGAVPLWFDVGYRFTKNLQAGVYFQHAGALGLAFVPNCPVNGNCSGSSYRTGLEVIGSLLPDGTFDPWAGVGIGYEWLASNVNGNDRMVRGMEWLNLQLGVDWRASRTFAIGPFVSLSVGRFGSESLGGVGTDFNDMSTHNWLQAGLRTSFRF